MSKIRTLPANADSGRCLTINDRAGNHTIFVIPQYRGGEALAWCSRWRGMDHHQSKFFSQGLAERVVSHALSGLNFGARS